MSPSAPPKRGWKRGAKGRCPLARSFAYFFRAKEIGTPLVKRNFLKTFFVHFLPRGKKRTKEARKRAGGCDPSRPLDSHPLKRFCKAFFIRSPIGFGSTSLTSMIPCQPRPVYNAIVRYGNKFALAKTDIGRGHCPPAKKRAEPRRILLFFIYRTTIS